MRLGLASIPVNYYDSTSVAQLVVSVVCGGAARPHHLLYPLEHFGYLLGLMVVVYTQQLHCILTVTCAGYFRR